MNVQKSRKQLNNREFEGIEPTSGFVDDDGNPISIEEYNRIRERESQSIIQREPLVSALVFGLIVGVAVYMTRKRKK